MAGGAAKLGIIAGGGSLPVDVAKAATTAGREVHIIGIHGEADATIAAFPHDFVKWGEIGRLFAILQQQSCTEVVIIGRVKRPDISQVRMDLGAIKLLPFIAKLTTSGGDDSLLSRIANLFDERGHRVCSVLDVVPTLTAATGSMTRRSPDEADEGDIARGVGVIRALGPFDVGQAVVVARRHVLAIEAAEGTDRMLERCSELRQWGRKGRSGVLVKTPKPTQDRRIDLPTIGPRTIELAAAAGLVGIALAAGETLIAERDKTLALADSAGLFVIGFNVRDIVASAGEEMT